MFLCCLLTNKSQRQAYLNRHKHNKVIFFLLQNPDGEAVTEEGSGMQEDNSNNMVVDVQQLYCHLEYKISLKNCVQGQYSRVRINEIKKVAEENVTKNSKDA